MCRSGYYQLWQLRPLVRSMSSDAITELVQAFISCCLDYCNSMFYGITDGLMSRLQSVQNPAARLVLGTRRSDHITPMLQELHCLPVQRWVDFKMATLVYLSLSGMAPPYLASDCQLVSGEGCRQLRSANSRTCRQKDLQQLWRQMLCCYRSEAVEQSASSSETAHLVCILPEKAVLEMTYTVLGGTLNPTHSLTHLRQTDINFEQFKRQLKTLLFGR